MYALLTHESTERAASEQPDVIFISIDSWRSDHVPGRQLPPGVMPYLETLIEDAAVIEQAFTPLARSFPAFWTVFTGQFPPRHGIRMNLSDDSLIATPSDLLRAFGDRGYYRLFAMDERRFANIREDQRHAADQPAG